LALGETLLCLGLAVCPNVKAGSADHFRESQALLLDHKKCQPARG